MQEELRGLSFAWSILAIFVGITLCAFGDRAGIATTVVIVYIIFFVVCGTTLKFREDLRVLDLFLASIFPPLVTVAYVTVAVRRLHCTKITAGTENPSLDYLAEVAFYGMVLVWMGIAASSVIRRAAQYWDSPAFLSFLRRQTKRVEVIGKLIDKLSGLSKVAKWIRALSGDGTK